MGRLVPTFRVPSGSTRMVLMMVVTLTTVARVANGCGISGFQVSERNDTTITVTWSSDYYVNSYRFQLYDSVQTASSYLYAGSMASTFTFTNLVPGRSYSISVIIFCSGVSYYRGTVNDRTLPPTVNVTISVNSSTTITVSWVAPIADVDYYIVDLRETNNLTAVNSYNASSTNTTQMFTGLVPGRSYNASVTAYSGDNFQSSAIVTARTYPATVKGLSCSTYSAENISCSWSLPDGVWGYLLIRVYEGGSELQYLGIFNNGYVLTVYATNETVIEHQGKTNTTFAMLGRLQPNTQYTVYVTTYLGDSSKLYSGTVHGQAKTDISAPPPVPDTVNITTVPNLVTVSGLTVSFSCSWFQSTNGDLKFYTVIVKQSEDTNSDGPEKKWPLSTYAAYTAGSTNVYQVEDRAYPTACSNPTSTVNVQLGTGSSSGNFYDGPLKQNTAYRISFRAYTYLPNSRSVRAGGVAIYTDTRFSLPLKTLATTSGSIVGPVVGGVLGGLVVIAGVVLLYMRREQLGCIKKPASPQETSAKDQRALPDKPKIHMPANNIYADPDEELYEDPEKGYQERDRSNVNGAPVRAHGSNPRQSDGQPSDAPLKTKENAKKAPGLYPTSQTTEYLYINAN